LATHQSEGPATGPVFAAGQRVSVATSGEPETGTFQSNAGLYFDGTPAAWVDLDHGPVGFFPIADLSPLRTPRRTDETAAGL